MQQPGGPEQSVYTPSQLNRLARQFLSDAFPALRIIGEISNLARPRSGHIYFTLKDAKAQIRCAMFKPKSTWLDKVPADGDQVELSARVSLYEARGEYQLIVDSIRPAGTGDLAQQLEQLRRKLDAEGLFASERKRPLPAMPRSIGLITSASGAAIRDFLAVIGRRFPLSHIRLYPTSVQGMQAGSEIVAALQAADQGEHDVLVITRGGGSLEDLWSFNDEHVVRAVATRRTPTVAAIGHESDVTLSELAADLRAATPSVAAESVVPDRRDLSRRLQLIGQRLTQAQANRRLQTEQHLDRLEHRLWQCHPLRQLREQQRQLRRLGQRLGEIRQQQQRHHDQRVAALRQRLVAQQPQRLIQQARTQLEQRSTQLQRSTRQRLQAAGTALDHRAQMLNELSPLATLDRGYAVARNEDGQVLREVANLQPGAAVEVIVREGRLQTRVESVQIGRIEAESKPAEDQDD